MLVTAVDGGSLSAAARELKIPVSTLTRKVADLEELLGTRLLIRTTRKLTLAVPKRSMTNRYRIPRFSAFSPD